MNKLLKVLEDRKVFLESAYYNPEDSNIPSHIHDIFQNGLPADFRLIGATTRMPEEIPPAIRSRCMEIFFRPLRAKEIGEIARQALKRTGVHFEEEVVRIIQKYATNGREVVNIVQTAVGLALTEKRNRVLASDVEWVVHNSQLSPRPELKMPDFPQVGVATGLAVSGPNMSALLEIEVTAVPAEKKGGGSLRITGVVDEEELGSRSRTLRRKSMARGSVENVMTVLRRNGFSPDDYHLHVNFPGGVPVDGPSAGVTIATAIVSAIRGIPVDNRLAMTGELSIHGRVKPVGGVVAKVDAARQAGASRVIIPEENMQSLFEQMEGIRVIPVRRLEEVLDCALLKEEKEERERSIPAPGGVLTASTTPV
jgi:Lon-like ATP-dependent protease